MTHPDKDPKPSEPSDPPAMSEDELDDLETRMADYLLNGEIDGEAFDGDPADLDWF